MHRLSRLSATFTGRKNDVEVTVPASSTADEGCPRPSVLPITRNDDADGGVLHEEKVPVSAKGDEEWFELHSVTPSSPTATTVTLPTVAAAARASSSAAATATDAHSQQQQQQQQQEGDNDDDKHCTVSSKPAAPAASVVSSDHHIPAHADPSADIESMEQSLISLLDDFRSGRMNALSEERVNQMRKARKDMEELTAFHVKLHRQQTQNQTSMSESESLNEQYDALFGRLDQLHSSMRIMSFGEDIPPQNSTPIHSSNESFA